MFKKARTLMEAANACKLEPLESGDPRYFDFSAARDFKLKSILNSLETSAAGGDFLHFALGGHRGCGKSTEPRGREKGLSGALYPGKRTG